MKDYLLTIRVPLKAMDDLAARDEGKRLLGGCEILTRGGEVKLQEIHKNREPRRVWFELEGKEDGEEGTAVERL